jgi:hypothetical protein
MVQKNDIPLVMFQSGWLLDDSIAEIAGTSISPEATHEISERLLEFQSLWNEQGPQLLRAIVLAFPLRFREKDINAFLVCGPLFSQSHPLLINVKYFLRSLHQTPEPMYSFIETVLHELLHILLQDCLQRWPTPAVTELAEDNFEIAAHLHLMTLQKFAHESTDKTTAHLTEWYQLMGSTYARTWELVNDPPTYARLLNELHGGWFSCPDSERELLPPNF